MTHLHLGGERALRGLSALDLLLQHTLLPLQRVYSTALLMSDPACIHTSIQASVTRTVSLGQRRSLEFAVLLLVLDELLFLLEQPDLLVDDAAVGCPLALLLLYLLLQLELARLQTLRELELLETVLVATREIVDVRVSQELELFLELLALLRHPFARVHESHGLELLARELVLKKCDLVLLSLELVVYAASE